MYSTEQRRVAIETFVKFDHSYADTIAEPGYPNRHTLNNWWREYKATGEVPVAKAIREPRFSDGQKREAVEHYLSHGERLKRTMRALGYPKSRMTLCGWIDELAPGQRKRRGPNPKRDPTPIEKKVQVVAELEARTGPAAEIAELLTRRIVCLVAGRARRAPSRRPVFLGRTIRNIVPELHVKRMRGLQANEPSRDLIYL